ncbi:hypothetical protein ACHAPX_009271 [Trichoderma viride]
MCFQIASASKHTAFRKLKWTERSGRVFVEAQKWFGAKFWRSVAKGIDEAETNDINSKISAKPRSTE